MRINPYSFKNMTREDIIQEAKRICFSSNARDYIEFVGRLANEELALPSELEEAARVSAYSITPMWPESDIKSHIKGFIAGAKWQAEQTRDEHFWNGIQYAKKELREFFNKHNEGDATIEDCFAYKEGYEHGRDEMKEIIEVAEDHAMLAGRVQMKEEMMKGAVEGKVIAGKDGGQYIQIVVGDWKGLLPENVKLIVVQDEQRNDESN